MSPTDPETRFRAVFESLADIPEREWRHFWSSVRECRFAARQHLLREGHPTLSIHFVLSGLVRYYHNENGRELVRGFDYEDRFVTDYESVLTGQRASFSVQTIEPTRTLSYPAGLMSALYDRHPSWDRVGRRLLEEQWRRSADKERRFRILGPEAHYQALIERQSPLVERVPLNQLASFLQITPETLSRIRARLRRSPA